ncbi:MAG: response regulator transcription factor [Eubacteriales bacterium]|nr:response regulator transcription factor [Eubacteriales bacterium]
MSKRILIVDDDVNICELVNIYCLKEGFQTEMAHSGQEALDRFQSFNPDMIILDLMLPDFDGYQVCRSIRKESEVPILMLTARTESVDKVVGLEIGADDYLGKPFDANELIARVKAILRRSDVVRQANTQAEVTEKIVCDDLMVDKSSYTCELAGQAVDMPPKELELLYFLASHPNRVFSREQLLTQVWGYDFFGESRTVDVHVKRIREKIDQLGGEHRWMIKTVWGVGYKFAYEE